MDRPRLLTLILFSLIFAFSLFSNPSESFAVDRIVNQLGDAGDGVCDGTCTLRDAVEGAATMNGDTVLFNAGVTDGNPIILTGDITFADNILINGNGQTLTIINGGNVDNIFDNLGQTVTINDVTITNGNNFAANGGAVFNNSTLTINNSVISNSTTAGANGGGGIRNIGTLNLNNVTISGNTATGATGTAGGGAINSIGMITISNSLITSNTATNDSGGGIFNNGGTITITNSTISGNMTTGGEGSDAGGIFNDGTLTINNSTISNNTADDDIGGILHLTGTLNIDDSTISGNNNDGTSGATFNTGGGLGFAGGTTFITNSTISGNTSADDAGGMIIQGASTITIQNSLIADNTADMGGALRQDSGTLNFDNSIVANNTSLLAIYNNCDLVGGTLNDNGDNIEDETDCGFINLTSLQNTDPLLGPLMDNGGPTFTQALLPGSPAIDFAGICGLATDQRGFPREANLCDCGPFEAQKGTITIAKSTIPGGATGFNFTSDLNNAVSCDAGPPPVEVDGSFILDDSESVTCTATEGTYNVTEMVPGVFSLTIDCIETGSATSTDDTNNPSVQIDLFDDGDTADCTFTNSSTTNFTLTVTKAGSGSGLVTGPTGNPPDGGINCGTDCTEGYNQNADVTLTATPDPGSEFQGWSGDCDENGNVIIVGNENCIATFIPEGANPVLNPGDPIEITQNGDTSVQQGGMATLELNFRNATGSNLDGVTLDVFEEQMVVTKQDSTIVRFEPTDIFLEPDIGTCVELVDRVRCSIAQLVNDVDLFIDFEAIDVDQGDFDIPVQATSTDLGTLLSEAIARMRVTGSGCSVAPAGSRGLGSLGILALIPAVMLYRRLRRKK